MRPARVWLARARLAWRKEARERKGRERRGRLKQRWQGGAAGGPREGETRYLGKFVSPKSLVGKISQGGITSPSAFMRRRRVGRRALLLRRGKGETPLRRVGEAST